MQRLSEVQGSRRGVELGPVLPDDEPVVLAAMRLRPVEWLPSPLSPVQLYADTPPRIVQRPRAPDRGEPPARVSLNVRLSDKITSRRRACTRH